LRGTFLFAGGISAFDTGVSSALRSAIENWAKQQVDKPSRSEAIRRLIEVALATKSSRHRSGNK
jgi:metal-responsive CopG/Arc/MetJ family transcriptional regulator